MQPPSGALNVPHEPLRQQTVAIHRLTEASWAFPLPPNPFQHCGNVQCRFLGRAHCSDAHDHDLLVQTSENNDAVRDGSDELAREGKSTGIPPTVPRLSRRILRPCIAAGNAGKFLRTVAHINIRHVETGENGIRHYVVETSRLQQASRVPTNRWIVQCAAESRVLRRFSQFVTLRQTITTRICLNARFVCPLCREFEKIITFHPAQPWALACLATDSGLRKRILESFLRRSVEVVRSRGVEHERACRLCRVLPLILKLFLSESSV